MNNKDAKKELEGIVKMLVRRDFELMMDREDREEEVKKLKEIKRKFEAQNEELNKINRLMIGREKRMISLKKELEEVKKEKEKLRKKLDEISQEQES